MGVVSGAAMTHYKVEEGLACALLGFREHQKGRDCIFWGGKTEAVIYSYLCKFFPNKHLFISYLGSGGLI